MSGNMRDRRNWTLSLTVVVLVAVVAAVIGSLSDTDAKSTDRRLFTATAGKVLFDHGKHKQIADSCVQCHHDLEVKGLAEEPVENVEVVSCRECHPGTQPSDTRTVSCSECHDDDREPDMMTHDEYLEIDDHTCLGCHAPISVSSTFHTTCSNCHLDSAPERFAQNGDADQGVLCGACHLQ